MGIGTPGQAVKVAIDTGSSELWVDPVCEDASDDSLIQQCIDYGFYAPNASSTFTYLNRSNSIPYGIGWTAIQYVKDNIGLPNSCQLPSSNLLVILSIGADMA